MTSIISIIHINIEAVIKNIMTATVVLGFAMVILMIVAGTISIIHYGWSSQEASICGAIAFCAGMAVVFACYYIQLH